MGNRHGRPRPPIYPPNDPFFEEIGCTGLRQNEYTSSRLDKAPFLYFKINTRNYDHLFGVIVSILNIINPANAGNNQVLNTLSRRMTDPGLYTPDYFNKLQEAGLDGKVLSDKTTGASQATSSKPPIYNINNISDTRFVYGPIYLLTAYNKNDNIIESYLYFPSMTKDMKPWNNYNTLGMNHSWMYSILYKYRYHAYSSCNIRLGKRLSDDLYNNLIYLKSINKLDTPDDLVPVIKQKIITSREITQAFEHGFKQGCVTSDFDNNMCFQSDAVHRGMGIYRDGLNSRAYPAVYFTTYKLNLDDKRINYLINANSFKDLQRNVIVEGIDIYPGCTFMLISPNQKYYLTLGNQSLILFYNTEGVNLYNYCFLNRTPKNKVPINGKIFQDCKITRGSIEGGYLNLYGISDYDEESIEELLFTLLLTNNLSYNISVVLTDNGVLNVMNNNNDILNTINISTGFKAKKPGITSRNYLYRERYNYDEDYKQRLINLMMYLKGKGVYQSNPFYNYLTPELENAPPESRLSATNSIQTGTQNYNYRSDIPRFDSRENYLQRYDQFFDYLRATNNRDSYKLDIINSDAVKYRPGGAETAAMESIFDSVNLDAINSFEPDSLYSGSNAVFKEETPDDRARRLDDESRERQKAYEEQQSKRGDTEDSLFTLSGSNVEFGESKLQQRKSEIYSPNYDAYLGEYSLENQQKIRLLELNDYFKLNYPDYIDYFKMEFEKKQQLDGVNKPPQIDTSKMNIVYNYDADRNSRLAMLNKI